MREGARTLWKRGTLEMTSQADDRTIHPHVPDEVLARHNARVLDPATAEPAPGRPAPRSTVYRVDRLFVPDAVTHDARARAAFDAALRPVHHRLAAPDAADVGLARLEVVDGARPTAIDAWVALRALRTAAAAGDPVKDLVDEVRLVHLLFAATDPTTNEPGPYEPSGPKPPSGTSTTSALRTLLSPPPDRDDEARRQPVVAVVDSDPDTHAEHGRIVTGILRRHAPRASLRPIGVMHPDGVVHEDDLVAVLGTLVDGVAHAQTNGDATGMVDVVSLSLGYFDEDDEAGAATSRLAGHVRSLTAMGVPVVAAAGNHGDHTAGRPYFPAALTAYLGEQDATQGASATPGVLSVGALESSNGNGTAGGWVRYWRSGTGPGDATGTSFAVPVLAAELVNAMDSATLGDVDATETLRRAKAAVATLES